MKVIIVPTIEHTGSMFVVSHLLKGMDRKNPIAEPTDNTVFFEHVKQMNLKKFRVIIDRFPIIVPLRHPKLVALSCERRGTPFWDDARKHGNYFQWQNLVREIDDHKPYYLPIDVENRDEYMDVICKDLGLDHPGWDVIHSKVGTSKLRHTDFVTEVLIEHEKVTQLLALPAIKTFLAKFYEETYELC